MGKIDYIAIEAFLNAKPVTQMNNLFEQFDNWLIPINTQKIETIYVPSNIDSDNLIKRHERGMQLLEAIQTFEKRKSYRPNNTDTINKCINKLYSMYKKTMLENI